MKCLTLACHYDEVTLSHRGLNKILYVQSSGGYCTSFLFRHSESLKIQTERLVQAVLHFANVLPVLWLILIKLINEHSLGTTLLSGASEYLTSHEKETIASKRRFRGTQLASGGTFMF